MMNSNTKTLDLPTPPRPIQPLLQIDVNFFLKMLQLLLLSSPSILQLKSEVLNFSLVKFWLLVEDYNS